MTRMQALATCRYYHGEEKCGYMTDRLYFFWKAEEFYVNKNGELNEPENSFYKGIGGKDFPAIPRPVLITMFFMWGKSVYSPKEHISDFYKLVDDYLEIASEFYPKDRIPG
ncbi:MAG: hypothetical protein MJZ81_06300 [Bacteroidales bacterium]|nr:hypothetical protein [Bacteroidales bacterium]